ncbi:MAG: phosphoribosylamine--glycine ligase [Acidobacteriota bacterium]|jgi:phosphoribosylamine--glycine ligase
MRVLVIGSGGREHALCWKLAQSPELEELYCAPGNPGIGEVADLVPKPVDEIQDLASFAADLKIDLTVVGPELPLTLGLADELARRGLAVFGPSREAARLEGSKVFAKEFMGRHGIPTGAFEVAHDLGEARKAAKRMGLPVVLKADGLAGGKGVLIPETREELDAALETFFEERRFGAAGDRVVVEEHLSGEEVSFIALSDGERLVPLATSKDYKRIGEGDTGPNTGGMGAHSPAGVLGGELGAEILESVMHPTVEGMALDNHPFRGILYAGLMLTDDGPKVLEFNVRLGDPEAQPLLMRMEDDLLPVLAAGAGGDFGGLKLRFKKEAAACVVLASRGYPGKPVRGEPIHGIDVARGHEGVEVFHAGTAFEDRDGRTLVSAGGRVLDVCATGDTLVDALRRAYGAAAEISWPSQVYRRDVGRRVLE